MYVILFLERAFPASNAFVMMFSESVTKSGAAPMGMSMSTEADGVVYGLVNLSGVVQNGFETLKETVLTISQVDL